MDSIFNLNALLIANLVLLTCLFFYLLTKIKKHPSVAYFVASLTPLIAFQVGSYMFNTWPSSQDGARLVIFGVTLTPLTIVPLSHTLGRTRPEHPQKTWIAYYALQIVLLVFVTRGIFAGRMIEWVTGILDQPIIIIEQSWRYYFLNVVATSMLALMCFDRTRQAASKAQQEALKFVFIAFLGFAVYFGNLSPHIHSTIRSFVTRHFFRNKYDYRDLWMKFSEKSSGSLNIRDLLPPVAEFVADAMFVRQVVFWLRSTTSETYNLAYCHDRASGNRIESSPLKLDRSRSPDKDAIFFRVPTDNAANAASRFPLDKLQTLKDLAIQRLVLVEKGNEVLALMGIGAPSAGEKSSAEDDQFLLSVSNQLGHLILTHKLSEELLLSREWDSFNRFASFILHDLKNLATMQGMTLENSKHLSHNPKFVTDAFATFSQTTDKMINLIASLSVQRGQFSHKQQPVNILEVLTNTFDDLKIKQRDGVRVLTAFPPKDKLPIICGDPELLQKAFTNLLLNAIQSLPKR